MFTFVPYIRSTNNNIAQIAFRTANNNSPLSLDKEFSNSLFSYTVQRVDSIPSVALTLSLSDSKASATFSVNGKASLSANNSQVISWTSTENTAALFITLVVSAEDNSQRKTFTIRLNPIQPPFISSLSLSNSLSFSPSFSPSVLNYRLTVLNTVSSITLSWNASSTQTITTYTPFDSTLVLNSASRVDVQNTRSVSLNEGFNGFEIRISLEASQDIYTSYRFVVIRSSPDLSKDSSLKSIEVVYNPINFKSSIFVYDISETSQIDSISLSSTANDKNAVMSVRNSAVSGSTLAAFTGASQSFNLQYGMTIISILVVAQDGLTNSIYSVRIRRDNPIASLSLLGLFDLSNNASISLSPSFSSNVLSYTASVTSSASNLLITYNSNSYSVRASAADDFTKIITSDPSSVTVSLGVGMNTISLLVNSLTNSAVQGQTYQISVNRAAPPSAPAVLVVSTISSLTLTSNDDTLIPIKPSFSSFLFSGYASSVPSSVSSIKYTVIATASGVVSYQVGSSSWVSASSSGSIELSRGFNTISFRTISTDGITIRSYSIRIFRGDSNPLISSLRLNQGSLNFKFSQAIRNYNATVPADTSSITFEPVTVDPFASLQYTINDGPYQGFSSSFIATLNDGLNNIKIQCTSSDGEESRIYNFNVRRLTMDSNAFLSDIALSTSSLRPGFQSNIYDYNVAVDNDISSITFTPTAQAGILSSITLGDNIIVSGSPSLQSLQVGSNSFAFEVTSKDSSRTLTYQVTVVRKPKESNDDATLSSISVSESVLTPSFNPFTNKYDVVVENQISSINVGFTANKQDASVSLRLPGDLSFSSISSSDIELAVGANVLRASIVSSSGVVNIVTINIIRKDSVLKASLNAQISNPALVNDPQFQEDTMTVICDSIGLDLDRIFDTTFTLSNTNNMALSGPLRSLVVNRASTSMKVGFKIKPSTDTSSSSTSDSLKDTLTNTLSDPTSDVFTGLATKMNIVVTGVETETQTPSEPATTQEESLSYNRNAAIAAPTVILGSFFLVGCYLAYQKLWLPKIQAKKETQFTDIESQN